MPALEIEVYSNPLVALHPHDPMWGLKDYSPLSAYDLQLLKPALLFGDHVNLISFRETMQQMVWSQAKTLFVMPMPRLGHFMGVAQRRDPSELDRLGLKESELPAQDETAEALRSWRSGGDVDSYWEKYEELVERAANNARSALHLRFQQLTATELKPAIDRGLLSVEGWLPPFTETPEAGLLVDINEMYDASLDMFMDRLSNANHQPMLDAGSKWVEENWITTGSSTHAAADTDWHSSTVVAADLIIRLPGLDRLPLSDVIDLRADLKAYLPAFRSEMIRLSEDVTTSESLAPRDLSVELNRRWHRDIAPVVEEIREQVVAASYPRRLLNTLTSEKDSLIALGGAFMLGAGSVAAGLSALIPAGAGAVYPFVKALNESASAHREAKKNRLYFLYGLQQGISQRAG